MFANTSTGKSKRKSLGDSVPKELNERIYKLPDPPKLELGDGLLN